MFPKYVELFYVAKQLNNCEKIDHNAFLTGKTVGLDDVGDEEDSGEDKGDAPGRDVQRTLTLLEPVLSHFA